jgi:hypothetical protein
VSVAATASDWATVAWSQGRTARRCGQKCVGNCLRASRTGGAGRCPGCEAPTEVTREPADRSRNHEAGGATFRWPMAAAQRRHPNSVVTDFGGYEKGIPVSRMPHSDPKRSPETLLGCLLGGLFEALFLQGLFGLLLCLFLRVLCFCHGNLHLCGFETSCRKLTAAGPDLVCVLEDTPLWMVGIQRFCQNSTTISPFLVWLTVG